MVINSELTLAYELKENYSYFNSSFTYMSAIDKYDSYIDDFITSEIGEYKSVSGYLIEWRKEILNSFIQVSGRRISNRPSDSAHGKIKVILKKAMEYKNFPRLRNRIMYSLSKELI